MTDFLFGGMVQNNTPINISSAVVAANVSVTGSGLPTIGIFSPSTNQLGFATNSTQQVVVDASGNMGIGTPSPSQKLVVYAASGAAVSLVQATTSNTAWFSLLGNGSTFLSGDFNFYHDGTQAGIRMSASLPMTFATANTERMRISNTGQVAINTSTPSTESANAKLVVVGTAAQDASNLATSNSNAIVSFRGDSNSGYSTAIGTVVTTNYQYIQAVNFNGGAASTNLLLNPYGGSIGIGTVAPGYLLDVSAAARIGGSTPNANQISYVNGTLFNQSTANWNYGQIGIYRNSSNSNPNKFIELLFDGDSQGNTTVGGTNAIWAFTNANPTTGSTTSGLQAGLIYGAYYGHRWNVNGTESMRITSLGNVGINTTSVTAGTMLAVAGGNISLYGSTSGVINLAAPAVAGTNTITFPAASGTVLLSSTAGITTGTAITPTSGTTAVLATGLPSTIKRITIQFYNIVMATAASDLIVQLGTSGGFVNTGYSSSGTYVTNASVVGFASASNGMIIAKLTNQATQTLYGAFVLTTVGGNIWVGTGISDITQNTGLAGSLGGYISLGGALTQLQISTISGTPTFSSGTFNILYE